MMEFFLYFGICCVVVGVFGWLVFRTDKDGLVPREHLNEMIRHRDALRVELDAMRQERDTAQQAAEKWHGEYYSLRAQAANIRATVLRNVNALPVTPK